MLHEQIEFAIKTYRALNCPYAWILSSLEKAYRNLTGKNLPHNTMMHGLIYFSHNSGSNSYSSDTTQCGLI